MAGLHLILADTNAEYCDALYNYVKNNYNKQFRMDCFTDYNVLTEYLDTLVSADILLMNSEFFSHDKKSYINKFNVVLELKENSNSGKSEHRCINKYVKIDNIVNNVIDIYSEEHTQKNNNISTNSAQENTQIILVCSPEGGSGKTFISTSLAVVYSKYGRKPFYLNLEKFYSPVKQFNPVSVKGISDILFYMRNNEDNIEMKINSCKITESAFNIDFLSPVGTPLELDEMKNEELIQLVKEIKKIGIYDSIIIDASTSDMFGKDFIEICTKIVIPYTYTRYGIEKLKSYIKYIKRVYKSHLDLLENSMIFTANKSDDILKDEPDEFIKSPLPIPFLPEFSNQADMNIVANNKAILELYNAININI